MAFEMQQMSDYGTTNPIVARLSIQTRDVLDAYKLPKAQRDDVFRLMVMEVQPRLLACYRLCEQLTTEVRAHQKKIDDAGLDVQANGRGYTLPSIVDVRNRAEMFLYNAKSVLRDFGTVFMILFKKDFKKEARYDKVLKWAQQKFGGSDPLTMLLQQDQTWLKQIVNMRNAVEHPGGYSGVLHVKNFTANRQGPTVFITEPVWYLNSEPQQPIANEMSVLITNLLTFCEEVLILALGKFELHFPQCGIWEIPEAKRDPQCPVRFKPAVLVNGVTVPMTVGSWDA